MTLLNALSSVLSIVLMLAVGYYAARKKWLNDGAMSFISKIVVNVALPCNMISKIPAAYTREQLFEFRYVIFLPLITMTICYSLGLATAKIFKLAKNRHGTFAAMFATSNTIFMGLPVNMALFGADSETAVYLYYMANTFLIWTFFINGIQNDGLPPHAKTNRFSFKNVLKIFNGGMIGLIAGLILVVTGVKLPVFLNDTAKYFGTLVTPLPMLFIGSVIYNTDWKKYKFTKDVPLLLIGRFVLSPLLVLLAAILIGGFIKIDKMIMNVFIIQAAMPVMSQIPILTKAYNADGDYAAIMTSITTVLSLLVIPVIKVML